MEENKYSIIANNISKGYKMYSSPKQKLLDLILPKGAGKTFYALKDLTFKVEKGDVVGLIGLNGSGKSTLSNILGGVSMPTKGEIQINGESALIAIGLGMNNFLTGIENIELKALMMGYKKEEIEKIKQEVIDFADIGEFINQPLRTYSSGMRSRLGFAISVYTNPDILVIDEALSVGDQTFTQKCLDKMNEFKAEGKTIFFVSHSLGQVKQFCNKAMWLEYGVLREYGDIDEVLPEYQRYINQINEMTEEERAEYKRCVLKEQEHSLLQEFKLIDHNIKKFKSHGKVIKSVKLINNKMNVKDVIFNFDITTFAFGFLPSIFRKRYEVAVMLLIIQLLNFFIVPLPIGLTTNFIITAMAACFTGRGYVNFLIEKKKFFPYDIWVNLNIEKNTWQINKRFKNKKRINLFKGAISIIFVSFVSSFAIVYPYRDKISTIINEDNSQISIKDFLIIMVSEKNGKTTVDNILVLNSKPNSELVGVVYPGKIQVKHNNKYDELNKVASLDNIENFNKIIKSNFNINSTGYIVVNSDISKNKDLVKNYEILFDDVLQRNDEEFEKIKDEILQQINTLTEDKLQYFYNEFKGSKPKISNLKYDEVFLKDIIEDKILEALNMKEKGEYKFITTDKRSLSNNILVLELYKAYEKYLSSGQAQEIIKEDGEVEVWDSEVPSDNDFDYTYPNYNEDYPSDSTETNSPSGPETSTPSEEETTPVTKPQPNPPVVNPEPPVSNPEPDSPTVNPEPPVTEPETEPPITNPEPEPPVTNPEPPVEDEEFSGDEIE